MFEANKKSQASLIHLDSSYSLSRGLAVAMGLPLRTARLPTTPPDPWVLGIPGLEYLELTTTFS